MSIAVIRSEFHQLIDSIQDRELLQEYLEALRRSLNREGGELWFSLTQEQKNRVLSSFEESKHEENLISMEKMTQKHKKWLTK